MRFDLSSKVRFVPCVNVSTMELAFRCIEKMYWHAYGPKMGRPLQADSLTPNEERLAKALVEQFSDTSTYARCKMRPISVDCGDNTYVFVSVVDYEGPRIDYVLDVGGSRE